jgi:hypothetical protein
MSFRRKPGRAYFDQLREEKNVIEGEIGEPLQWVPGTSPIIRAVLPDASLKDRQDWRGQQEWLAAKLQAFLKVIVPRLQQLDSQMPASSETSETGKRHVAFWTEFREFMIAKGSGLKVTKPFPQCWNTISIGLGTTRLYAIASSSNSEATDSDANELRAEFVLEGKQAKSRYAKLIALRETIDAELGEQPTWYDASQVSSKIYFRQSANLLDKSEWPACFEWLKSKLELLQRVVSPHMRKVIDVAAESTT